MGELLLSFEHMVLSQDLKLGSLIRLYPHEHIKTQKDRMLRHVPMTKSKGFTDVEELNHMSKMAHFTP